MPNFINIWKWQEKNYVNGTGCRFVLWVQGCNLGCKECWNKHTWSFAKKKEVPVNFLVDKMANVQGIEGVTFTGGEPFLQAKSLFFLANEIKNRLKLNLHIFTGFELEELTESYQKKLLGITDVLVAGRFDPTKPNNNQKVYEFSNIKWNFNNTDVEIELDEKSNINITGYPSNALITNIKESIK